MPDQIQPTEINGSDDLMSRWQDLVDLLAAVANVPAALIMRAHASEIEVFCASRSPGNPYKEGERAPFSPECGLYCETVVRKRQRLLVPNALTDTEWEKNPDIALNMISYLGLPLLYPDGKIFGTICVLDSQENSYTDLVERCLVQFCGLLESHLALLVKNHDLTNALNEIKTLRGLIPICVFCKGVRNEKGYWDRIENYLTAHTEAELTHTFCDRCAEKHYPEYFPDPKKPLE
jgi:hypothetical protein